MTSVTRKRLLELTLLDIDRATVAARLDVSVPMLERWVAGQSLMQDGKLARLLDLLDETHGNTILDTRSDREAPWSTGAD